MSTFWPPLLESGVGCWGGIAKTILVYLHQLYMQRRKYIKSIACGSVCFALCSNGEQWSIYKENPLRPSFVQRWVWAASWKHWFRTKHWRISRNCCDVDKWDPLYTQFIPFLTLLMVETAGVEKGGGAGRFSQVFTAVHRRQLTRPCRFP